MSQHTNHPVGNYRLPKTSSWAGAWKISATLAAIGVAACALGASSEPKRFAFAWLFAFMATLAIALGSLFFVIIQHLTGAGWSVTLRRTSEFLLAALPVFALLFLPIALNTKHLYPWVEINAPATSEHHGEGHHEEGHHDDAAAHAEAAHGDEVVHDDHHSPEHTLHTETVRAKRGYLNTTRFYIFAAAYFIVWTGLALFFFLKSTRQDRESSLETTKSLQRFAPAATALFALSLTFAAFDWMMSLEPTWFSTIYGVQYFSVSVLSSLAVLVALTTSFRDSGLLKDALNLEHFHDLGKLLFGFLVFWAYISFSQFMLIWYASIPEETTYYHIRWSGGWQAFSILMVLVHFLVPFFLLISRNAKRRFTMLKFGALWILVTHVMECYWLVMPYFSPTGLSLHWVDFGALFAVAGIYFTVVFLLMNRFPLIPIGDPRLDRALRHEVI